MIIINLLGGAFLLSILTIIMYIILPTKTKVLLLHYLFWVFNMRILKGIFLPIPVLEKNPFASAINIVVIINFLYNISCNIITVVIVFIVAYIYGSKQEKISIKEKIKLFFEHFKEAKKK